MVYPFLRLPIGALAFERVLPVLLAVWLPNLMFATGALLLIWWNRIGSGVSARTRELH